MKRIRTIRTICGGAGVMMLLMAPAFCSEKIWPTALYLCACFALLYVGRCFAIQRTEE